jgi:NitT/TauT family transport system substrate-binding protein
MATAGCSASAAAPEKPDLTVSVVPSADSAGFFIALQHGLFAAQGLRVTYVPASSDSALVVNRQVAGSYDITGESYVSYIQAAAHQHDRLRIIAEGSDTQPNAVALYTMPGSQVRTVAGLENSWVGVDAMFSTDYLLDVAALVDQGLSAANIRFVPVSLPDMGNALRSHLIDVATLPEPYATGVQETTGAVELADLDRGATQGFPTEGYAVTRAWAARYPNTLAAFLRALEQGQEIADSDEGAIEQAMETYTLTNRETAVAIAPETYPLGIDPTRIQRVANLMTQFGLLAQPFQVQSMITG